ncbi:MAG: transglycosylase SLT domain-containing protein [Saprospiraceae bacterium]|nr:transglycosylase SLT domain-containing protein [Saprospiraceae bacterium]
MNKLSSIFVVFLLVLLSHNANSHQGLRATGMLMNWLGNKPEFYEEEVRSRLESMDCLVTLKIEDDVIDQVKRFVGRNKTATLEILKRTENYFPLIDRIFTENNLPTDLKYLTIVESALQLDAKSHVGAAGIWQLMPATARILKLRVDSKVDQRLDPVLATQAAALYFKNLYAMFNDWSLVIAAYNCGEYRVKDLIESSKATDFWGIKKLLPRQTQLFVPAFIGASYFMKYHPDHNIIPVVEEFPDQKITFAKIYKEVNLRDLFKKTGIKKELFLSLNPSYKRFVIPGLSSGSSVSLPDSLMVEFVDYYRFQNKFNPVLDEARVMDDAMPDHEVISFNRPFIFAPDNISIQNTSTINLAFESASIKDIKTQTDYKAVEDHKIIRHLVKTRESLSEIADRYQVDLEELLSWNELNPAKELLAGTVIKIKPANTKISNAELSMSNE